MGHLLKETFAPTPICWPYERCGLGITLKFTVFHTKFSGIARIMSFEFHEKILVALTL